MIVYPWLWRIIQKWSAIEWMYFLFPVRQVLVWLFIIIIISIGHTLLSCLHEYVLSLKQLFREVIIFQLLAHKRHGSTVELSHRLLMPSILLQRLKIVTLIGHFANFVWSSKWDMTRLVKHRYCLLLTSIFATNTRSQGGLSTEADYFSTNHKSLLTWTGEF